MEHFIPHSIKLSVLFELDQVILAQLQSDFLEKK